MPRLIILLSLFLTTKSFAYECKGTELNLDMTQSKKELTQELKTLKRQQIFEGLLYEISETKGEKNIARALAYSNFLHHTEADLDQRSFIELLKYSSELESGKIKLLKWKEICDLNGKILKLKLDHHQ